MWQNGGKFQLIDRAGQVVVEQDPVKDAAAFATLPLVVGAGAPENAAALLDQLAALPALRARVVAAVRVGERRWNLRLNNGADVLLPEGAEVAGHEPADGAADQRRRCWTGRCRCSTCACRTGWWCGPWPSRSPPPPPARSRPT